MARRHKQSWSVGDYFTITLSDNSCVFGQVIGYEAEALNSVICAIFSKKVDGSVAEVPEGLTERDLIAVQFVTRDLLDSSHWRVFAHGLSPDPSRYLPLNALKRDRFIGATIEGSGIIVEFMNAYFALLPWNGFHDPGYFDKLLLSPDRKPEKLLLKQG